MTIFTTALAFCMVDMFDTLGTLYAACERAGFLMLGSVKNINRDDLKIAIPAFLTLAVMPFTYNISYGIAFGLISYVSKRLKAVHG